MCAELVRGATARQRTHTVSEFPTDPGRLLPPDMATLTAPSAKNCMRIDVKMDIVCDVVALDAVAASKKPRRGLLGHDSPIAFVPVA